MNDPRAQGHTEEIPSSDRPREEAASPGAANGARHAAEDPRDCWLGARFHLAGHEGVYVIDEHLDAADAAGAHAWVFKAKEEHHPDDVVAIKVAQASDADLGARLQYEATIFSRVHHGASENARRVVTAIGSGVHPADTENGRHRAAFLVLEFLDGGSVHYALAHGRFAAGSSGRAALIRGVILDTVRGVAAFHAKDIVHRDIKPSNIVMLKDALDGVVVKVVDAGIAKDLADEGRPGTETHAAAVIEGTIPYAPPETWKEPRLAKRGEVYSVALTCMEIIAGRPLPAAGKHEYAPHVEALVADAVADDVVPSKVREVLRKGMQRQPEDRQANAGVLLAELLEAFGESFVTASADSADSAASPSVDSAAATVKSSPTPPTPPRPSWVRPLGLALVAVAALVWYALAKLGTDVQTESGAGPKVDTAVHQTASDSTSKASGDFANTPPTIAANPGGTGRSTAVTVAATPMGPAAAVPGAQAPVDIMTSTRTWMHLASTGDIRYHAAERLTVECGGDGAVAVRGSWDEGLVPIIVPCGEDGWVRVSQHRLGLDFPDDAGKTYCLQFGLTKYSLAQRQRIAGADTLRSADTVIVRISDGSVGRSWSLVDSPASKLSDACARASRSRP